MFGLVQKAGKGKNLKKKLLIMVFNFVNFVSKQFSMEMIRRKDVDP